MFSSSRGSISSKERRRRRREAKSRLQAIASFLIRSERRGLRISPHAQYLIENECLDVYKAYDESPDTFEFATMLRETAVRMFRQGRYKEANQRYRMASLFNPYDPTLLSNRATCIFNLRRYRRCIEICQLCFSAFPDLYYEDNTGLYFQILILLANAHLQLHQFPQAIEVYNTLLHVKEKLHAEKGSSTDLTVKEASNKIRRFEMDLKLAANSESSGIDHQRAHEDPDKPVRPRNFPYHEERGRFLHPHTPRCYLREINTGIDDYDLSSDEDGDPSLIVNVENLCHHVYHMGMGQCAHDDDDFIWPYESDSCSASADDESVEYELQAPQTQCTHVCEGFGGNGDYETCECHCDEYHEEGEDAEGAEVLSDDLSDLPQLKEADSESDDDSTNDGLSEALDGLLFSNVESSAQNMEEDVRYPGRNKDRGYTLNSPERRISRFPDVLSLREAVEARRMSHSSPEQHIPRRNGTDAHYWRLVTELACFASKKMYKPTNVPQANRMFYDSETEEPINQLDYSIVAEAEAADLLETASAVLPEGNGTFLSRCIEEIFGQSFQSKGTLDFTRYFGSHSRLKSHNSKKKAKGCDRNCAPCFARRMWKSRFKSSKLGSALQLDGNMLGVKPIDDKIVLFQPEWFFSGYYGSGYETADAVAVLVHGVAYSILLQSEVSWQRNGLRNITDMQRRFNKVLLENVKTRNDLRSVFALFCMLSETLNLIDCINYHASKGIPRSPQFTNTSQLVAENLRSTPDLQRLSGKDREAALLTRNATPSENLSNWSMKQYIAKEEEWVYQTLFRDVREIILHIERKALGIVPNPMPFIMNSSGSETDLLITGLYKQRSRELEKKSSSRKHVDLRRSEKLLNRVLEAHPSTARLYFKRAEVRFLMKNWDSCIKDLCKLQSLVTRGGRKGKNQSAVQERERVLLYHSYKLEGDAHREKAKETSPPKVSHITTSIDRYRKALAISPSTNKNRTHLLKKIQEQQDRMTSLESKTRKKRSAKSSTNTSQPQRKQRSPVETKGSTGENSQGTSSSDENEDMFVPGSRYGALLGRASKPPPATNRKSKKLAMQKSSGSVTNSPGKVSGPGQWHRKKKEGAPTVDDILSQVHKILSLFGGEARSSDVMGNLDFTQWFISDPKTHIINTYGALHILCTGSGHGFEIRAGSQSDPVIGLTDEEEFTPVSRRKPCPSKPPSNSSGRKREVTANTRRRDRPRGRGSSSHRNAKPQSNGKSKTRMSQTTHYSRLVNELLKTENEKTTVSKEKASTQESDRDKECCICMDNPPDCLTMPCRHRFCESCILDYLARENSAKNCPVCRADVTHVASMAIH